jgi:hypothetical protein
MEKMVVVIIVVLMVPILLIAGGIAFKFLLPGNEAPEVDEDFDEDGYGDVGSNLGSSQQNFDPHNLRNNYTEADGPSFIVSDYCTEGITYTFNFTVHLTGGRLLKTLASTVNWTDEPDNNAGPVEMPNEPDEFKLDVVWLMDENTPDSQELHGDARGKNNNGRAGQASVEFEVLHTILEVQRGEGPWTVELDVLAGDYGKSDKPVYPTQPDDGNEFTLKITSTVYVPKE